MLHFQELATKTEYCERLLEYGINCGTQSFLISTPLLDQYSADGLDLRPMLEPALTKSLDLSTNQKEMVEKNSTDRIVKKKWEMIEHIYNVHQKMYLAVRELQRMLIDRNVGLYREKVSCVGFRFKKFSVLRRMKKAVTYCFCNWPTDVSRF